MMSPESLLTWVYAAFNNRDMEVALAALHPDVDWPNGMEGGRTTGREAVRGYWTHQWAVIDPRVEPVAFAREWDGRIAVEVRQIVRDREGKVLADQRVWHVYDFEDGLIRSMEIRGP